MINDSQIQLNMLTYLQALEDNYQELQHKKRSIEVLLFQSACKIQRMFRAYSLSKKTRSAIKIQRRWKAFKIRQSCIKRKLQKFRRLYYGSIINSFICKNMKKVSIEAYRITKCRHLSKVSQHFSRTISKESALQAENQYISKYRSYIHTSFNKEWEKYEKKVKKELWAAAKKKWVRVPAHPNIYLNQFDKQIDVEKYIQEKLDKIYEDNLGRIASKQMKLKYVQQHIQGLLAYERECYARKVIGIQSK